MRLSMGQEDWQMSAQKQLESAQEVIKALTPMIPMSMEDGWNSLVAILRIFKVRCITMRSSDEWLVQRCWWLKGGCVSWQCS